MINFCNLQWTTTMEGGRLIHTGQPWMWYDDDAVYVDDNNNVELTVYKDPTTITYEGKTYYPTIACGVLRSVDTFGYGKFSAKIQLPKGKNLWPCFWIVGSGEPWPACGEIDICEAWTPYFRLFNWRITHNIHWYDGGHIDIGSKPTPLFKLPCPTTNFVKYEVEWKPNTITFFVNGHHIRTYGNEIAQHLLNKKMRVIFDLWTTGKDCICNTPMKIHNFKYQPLKML